MLDRALILSLVPHQGAMCLLDRVESWSATSIDCRASSHLSPDNPLRHAGRLAGLCGIEYGLQAAAVHGGLLAGDGAPAPAGWLAAIRTSAWQSPYLDDPAFGELIVEADLLLRDPGGLIYEFAVRSAQGIILVSGRGTIALPGMEPPR